MNRLALVSVPVTQNATVALVSVPVTQNATVALVSALYTSVCGSLKRVR